MLLLVTFFPCRCNFQCIIFFPKLFSTFLNPLIAAWKCFYHSVSLHFFLHLSNHFCFFLSFLPSAYFFLVLHIAASFLPFLLLAHPPTLFCTIKYIPLFSSHHQVSLVVISSHYKLTLVFEQIPRNPLQSFYSINRNVGLCTTSLYQRVTGLKNVLYGVGTLSTDLNRVIYLHLHIQRTCTWYDRLT